MALSSKEKAQLLASLFARKMKVDGPSLKLQCEETVTKVEVTSC